MKLPYDMLKDEIKQKFLNKRLLFENPQIILIKGKLQKEF